MKQVDIIHWGVIEGQFDALRILCGDNRGCALGKNVNKFDGLSFWDIDPKKRCKKCEKLLTRANKR